MSPYLVIDAAKCTGHARCYLFAAPDLLTGDDEGFVSQRGTGIPLGPDDVDAAELAEESCPEQAISIVEETP